MSLINLLKQTEIFDGLSDMDLDEVSKLCTEKILRHGDIIVRQGEPGDKLFIVAQGFLEVTVGSGTPEERIVVNLGTGQIVGEMSLIDRGPRSATVRAISNPTIVQVINHNDFESLCAQNTRIGYLVMRNLAVDLSFKLRHQNMISR